MNSVGCDSVASLDLTINHHLSYIPITTCDEYTWNGQTYTEWDLFIPNYNETGCDSTASLELTIQTPTSSYAVVTECVNTLGMA